MRIVIALLTGALFGAGLVVSGMTDPGKVRGFLDLFGAWDPTLAFVMAGAVGVMAVGWRVAARLDRAATGDPMPGPAAARLDARLLGGAALFGLGWGLAGYCPGPAAASLLTGGAGVALFVAAMLAGMRAARWLG
ncbi:DUF6691 family protein [Paracoccus luteus]|uniref:DUF6691 family protein n=1 Tax=Paracoccus luteus TaxID=2508543 RepID=UPI001C704FC0|nr:DUF6691 family protein [Paracoccus luteus]